MDLPPDRAAVAGLASDESVAERIVAALAAGGIVAPSVEVCAADGGRAQAIGERLGIGVGISPDDPLAGAPGLDGPADQRVRSDRGAAWGALWGTAIGVALGLSPFGRIVPVDANLTIVADALFFLIIGIISGAVLGTALGPRLSTHVGYRLIDGMAEGSIAIIARCTRENATAASAAMAQSGATDVIVVD